MTDRNHIPQEDLALYAMQTLSQEESVAIRTHLATCALCRDELAELSGDLALVALSVEQHPVPEGARQRFLDKVAASPKAQPAPLMAEQIRKQRSRSRPIPYDAMICAPIPIALVHVGRSGHRLVLIAGVPVHRLNALLQRQFRDELFQPRRGMAVAQ